MGTETKLLKNNWKRRIIIILMNLIILLQACGSSNFESAESIISHRTPLTFCDENNLEFMQTIDNIDLYYIYNIPSRALFLKIAKFKGTFPVGCGGKYLVYCGCIGPDCNGLFIKHTNSEGTSHIYNDFNCFAENIMTGETKPLLDSVKQNIQDFEILSFYSILFESFFYYPPVVFGNMVLLSYLFTEHTEGDPFPIQVPYILILNIEDTNNYKFYEVPFAPDMSPAMSENYIVAGGSIYSLQNGEIKQIGLIPQINKNDLDILSTLILYAPRDVHLHSISGENLVYTKERAEQKDRLVVNDVYLYNIKELKEVKIYSNTDDTTSEHPSISGDKVVWMQSKRIKTELDKILVETSIMLYNLTTGELREIVPEKPNPLWPTTNGRYIAWLDTEVGDEETGRSPDVYLYDIETGETWKVPNGLSEGNPLE